MTTTNNTLNERAAKAAGYRALTSRYYLPEEQRMLDAVLADMRRGNISHVLVRDRLGVSVWRRGISVFGPQGPSAARPSQGRFCAPAWIHKLRRRVSAKKGARR